MLPAKAARCSHPVVCEGCARGGGGNAARLTDDVETGNKNRTGNAKVRFQPDDSKLQSLSRDAQGMPPPYHDVQQRPAIQDDRIQDVTSDYGVTQRRERVRRRESVYEAVGRPTGASAMAPVARATDVQ